MFFSIVSDLESILQDYATDMLEPEKLNKSVELGKMYLVVLRDTIKGLDELIVSNLTAVKRLSYRKSYW